MQVAVVSAVIAGGVSLLTAGMVPFGMRLLQKKDKREEAAIERAATIAQQVTDAEEQHRLRLYAAMLELRELTRAQVNTLKEIRQQIEEGNQPNLLSLLEQRREENASCSTRLDIVVAISQYRSGVQDSWLDFVEARKICWKLDHLDPAAGESYLQWKDAVDLLSVRREPFIDHLKAASVEMGFRLLVPQGGSQSGNGPAA